MAIRWAVLLAFAVWGFRKPTLRYWIFFAMFLGAEIGLDSPQTADHLRFLSDIFLRLVKVIIAPLILGSLTSGIAGHGDLKSLRRIGIKTIVYFEVVTTIALVIGLAAINLTKAGEGLAATHLVASGAQQAAAPLRWEDFLIHVFPENLAKSVAEDQLLQVAVFAVIFGIALARVQEADRAPVLNFCKSLTKTMFRFTNVVMYLAPAAAGAAVAFTVAHTGMNALLPLTKLMLAAYGAFVVFLVCVLLPIALWARLPIKRLVRAIAEPAGIAFATTTSEAALPRAMEEMEAFGVPRDIVAFVIPAGYSFNMDGTALYLTIAAVFTAQAAGIHMSWGTQMAMMLTLMLTSKGMAGVPRAMLVILMGTAATFHLPLEPIFVLLGIDAIVDMGRASMNVIGNCLASAVVARSEGALNSSPQIPAAS